MGTYTHTLTPLKHGTLPRRWLIMAAAPIVVREGHGCPALLHRLRLGALSYLRRHNTHNWSHRDDVYHTGEELLTLLDRYTSRREPTWLVAHDLAYHLTVSELWKHALNGGLTVESYHISGRSCTARLRIRGKLLHAVDSSNYLDKDFNWIAGAMGIVQRLPYTDSDADSEALDKARLEVETVRELIMRLCEMLDNDAGGAWGYSLGGIAWASWRRGLLGDKVHVHAHREATELERAAYVGARTECRFIGEVHGTITSVDYNSLYAHVMADRMPCRFIKVQRGEDALTVKYGLRDGYLAIARVQLDARLHDYPYTIWPHGSAPHDARQSLPSYIRPVPQHRRVWGRGRFTTTLATPELLRALETDEVRVVERVGWYEPGEPFRRFTNYWYDRRLHYRAKQRPAEESICKRLLTLLPGKFGQRAHDWSPVKGIVAPVPFGHWHKWDEATGEFVLYRALGGAVQRYSSPGEWEHSFPAISAHVTSGARVLVDTAVEIAGPLDCYYYDCDRLDVSSTGLERLESAGLLHETELGRLKIKGVYNGGSYRNIRDYRFGSNKNVSSPGKSSRALEGSDQEGKGANGTSSGCHTNDADDQQLRTLHSGSPVDNLLRAGLDAWRSIVSQRAAARYRYFGRVDQDGWVRPLWLPEACARASQLEIGSDDK